MYNRVDAVVGISRLVRVSSHPLMFFMPVFFFQVDTMADGGVFEYA